MSKAMKTIVMILGIAFAWLVTGTLSEMAKSRLAREQPESAEPRATEAVWKERVNKFNEEILRNPEFARQLKAEISTCMATGVEAVECTERMMAAYMDRTYRGK